MTGGKRSTANFVWRCGNCKRESSAKFEAASPPKPYSADANGQFAPLVTIECRGLEFVGFDPRVTATFFLAGGHYLIKRDVRTQGIWKCSGIDSGTPFLEVDLSEGEWVDYDEKVCCTFHCISKLWDLIWRQFQAALPVGVSAIESKWGRA